MVDCCACKGKGRKFNEGLGIDDGGTCQTLVMSLPCPYCNGTGNLEDKWEELSVGRRIEIYPTKNISNLQRRFIMEKNLNNSEAFEKAFQTGEVSEDNVKKHADQSFNADEINADGFDNPYNS